VGEVGGRVVGRGFRVDQVPRPLVLADSRVRVEQGFTTGEAKMAFLEGAIASVAAVPESVLVELSRDRRPARATRPLMITEATLEETECATDRGPRSLPAWRLTAEDALGPIWVLDPDVTDRRPRAAAGGAPPDVQRPGQHPGTRMDVGPDDRAVVFDWLGQYLRSSSTGPLRLANHLARWRSWQSAWTSVRRGGGRWPGSGIGCARS